MPVERRESWWDIKGEAFSNTPPDQDADRDGTAFVFSMRFPGRRYDSATGINQDYFRDYDTSSGQYGQSDPSGLTGGINTYAYVESSSLMLSDYLGLEKDQACVAGYTAAGAICGGAIGYYGGGIAGAVGGGFVCSPSGPGAAACAAGGAITVSSGDGAIGSVVAGVTGNLIG